MLGTRSISVVKGNRTGAACERYVQMPKQFLRMSYIPLQVEKEKAEEILAKEKVSQERDSLLKDKSEAAAELQGKSLKLQDLMQEVCFDNTFFRDCRVYTRS